jgi:hypothetical protein
MDDVNIILSLNYPIDFLSHNFIRFALTRAKALQTVSRFPRETRRRYAAPKSNAFALILPAKSLDLRIKSLYELKPF